MVTPILIGDFGLGEVEFFAALTNQAAEVAFETVGHDSFLSDQRSERGSESIIEEAAGLTKEDCYIDDISGASRQSVTREKAPIFTMGSADPRSYRRNKRGIAGSLIWINFDRHALLDLFAKAQGRFLANIDDIRPQFHADSLNQLDQTAIFNSALVRTTNSLTVATRSTTWTTSR